MNPFWLGLGALVGLFFGMVFHEYAHARVAVAFGDRTPKLHGRVTLNPKAHADPLGTIILPALFIIPMMVGKPVAGFLFGYAKPVPINPRMMRDQRRAPLVVALAGPATNFVLALLAGIGLYLLTPSELRVFSVVQRTPVVLALAGALTVNVFLGIINALPIPPLDGSRVLGLFLSPQAAYKLEEMSQYFLLFLIVLFLFFGRVLPALADPVCRALSMSTVPGCIL